LIILEAVQIKSINSYWEVGYIDRFDVKAAFAECRTSLSATATPLLIIDLLLGLVRKCSTTSTVSDFNFLLIFKKFVLKEPRIAKFLAEASCFIAFNLLHCRTGSARDGY
jgi:hypothetical protein